MAFCAHINAWPGFGSLYKGPLDLAEYLDIRTRVYARLYEHAAQQGWGPHNVRKDTVRLVNPHPRRTGFAIRHGIEDFLGLRRDELKAQVMTRRAHGFIVRPGACKENNDLDIIYLHVEEKTYMDERFDEFEPVPDVYKSEERQVSVLDLEDNVAKLHF